MVLPKLPVEDIPPVEPEKRLLLEVDAVPMVAERAHPRPAWLEEHQPILVAPQLSLLQLHEIYPPGANEHERFKLDFHFEDYLCKWLRLVHAQRIRLRVLCQNRASAYNIAGFCALMEKIFEALAERLRATVAQALADQQPRPNFEAVVMRCTSPSFPSTGCFLLTKYLTLARRLRCIWKGSYIC